MTALAITLIFLICLLLVLIGLVIAIACVNSTQFDDMVDRSGDAIYPDHRDHRNPVP